MKEYKTDNGKTIIETNTHELAEHGEALVELLRTRVKTPEEAASVLMFCFAALYDGFFSNTAPEVFAADIKTNFLSMIEKPEERGTIQ
ncbi:MAG: hypothetical protein KGL39_11640 [Patescibacteria group bacterium]|nr:hypothetical protein [Patescibacteria group bacterium]